LSKATQNNEVLAFADHWRTVTGTDPALLIFDSKVPTQAQLGKLTDRGITFVTLRARTPKPTAALLALPAGTWTPLTIARSGGRTRRVRRPYPPGPRHRRPEGDPVRLPRNAAPARRRRPGPRTDPPS
jgi:hypothetical protein